MLTQKQRNEIIKSRMELMREECRDDVIDGKITFKVKEFEDYINYIIQKTIQKTEENLTKHNSSSKKDCLQEEMDKIKERGKQARKCYEKFQRAI